MLFYQQEPRTSVNIIHLGLAWHAQSGIAELVCVHQIWPSVTCPHFTHYKQRFVCTLLANRGTALLLQSFSISCCVIITQLIQSVTCRQRTRFQKRPSVPKITFKKPWRRYDHSKTFQHKKKMCKPGQLLIFSHFLSNQMTVWHPYLSDSNERSCFCITSLITSLAQVEGVQTMWPVHQW